MTTARHDIDPRCQEPPPSQPHLGETAVAGALVACGVGVLERTGQPLYFSVLRVVGY